MCGGLVVLALLSERAWAQAASPFLTGATALQTNILAWLTPVAIILIMILGGMAMANRVAQVSNTYGSGEAQTIVENCGNTLILRCAGSEHGGTSHFASRLIGQREVVRTHVSRSRRPLQWLPSTTRAEHSNIEPAVLDSEIEQLPDLAGYLKFASVPEWYRVRLAHDQSVQRSPAPGGVRGALRSPNAANLRDHYRTRGSDRSIDSREQSGLD
jgi:hypothetical protein